MSGAIHLKQASIYVVIPSMNGEIDNLVKELCWQTCVPDQIKVVKGVSPNGRARNIGVQSILSRIRNEEKNSSYLVFIDDDAYPGSDKLIESLIFPLMDDDSIGITGTARVLPKEASWFQRRVAAEIPRTVNDIPQTPIVTNPPLHKYGHSLITTTCCAMRSAVYEEVGGFREDLTSGVDTDFFYRVRKAGYRLVMVPKVFVTHPAPCSFSELVRKFHWYGIGYAQETMRRPEQHLGPLLLTQFHRAAFLFAATLWLVPNIFILYSFGYPKFSVGFRPLKAVSTYAVAWGYTEGWRRQVVQS